VKVDEAHGLTMESYIGHGRAFVNGLLHFLFLQFGLQDYYKIVAVDNQGKTCKVICWPNEDQNPNPAFIGQSQGRLHCIGEPGKRKVEGNDSIYTGLSVWVLEDYDAEEWVLKHSVSFLELFGTKYFHTPYQYLVVAIHPDRNLVFFVHQWDRKLISYDLDSREVCVLRTLGHPRSSMTLYVPCFESSVLACKY